jgi:hypothetical protein
MKWLPKPSMKLSNSRETYVEDISSKYIYSSNSWLQSKEISEGFCITKEIRQTGPVIYVMRPTDRQ